ncbi:SH3 domain and tetratricopeptide repeat-containing protein 2 isoform X1 [Rhincodon typus]|uniref:SH3 domain and tetratricopeptide repeat-containing protein 2 isoform X1 n=1 Tax=Rhincodon typus TaxID=259920 RepID=UPI00202F9DF6|nr:SH3 domain and tetratricopeptide repeat-containing protein 2 isoform X1 [Rhincodon typus]XP_048459867.1 SH3 domain and tetratricopeptide repeat-containing protein 2 isoform X1 [Rhincodon typus]XP_048459868.1 SH3 domain and tetratricopeptide repeat-containing protein 2 isoform X1 [Rhincodon typus]
MQKIKSQQSHGPKTVCIANKKQHKTVVVESAKEENRTKGQNNSLELLPGTATYTDPLSDRVLNCNMHLNSTNSEETIECETDIKQIGGIEECYASTATAVAPGKQSPFVSLSSSGYCSELQRLSVKSHAESTHGDKMETDKWEHQSESQSLGINTGCGEHSLGSPVEQEFPKDVTLSYCVIRQKSRVCDSELQESARRRLCILESENKDIVALFNELSARLLSILAEKDRFILTFKTVEEIWKFTTYLSLGFVGRCLENLLFDQHFWLNVSLVEDVKIQVEVNEADLSMMYLDLLLQEGPFFTRILSNILKNEEEDVSICKDDLIMLKDIGKNLKWEATSLSTNETGLLPVSAPQALLYPFYQWFLKVRAGDFNGCKETKQQHFAQSIGTGTCIATVDYKEGEADELRFAKGEKIQIIGFLLSNLQWALGKSLNSGETGFVQIRHMQPDQFKTLDAHLLFLSDEEKSSLITFKKSDEQHCINLLKTLCQSDISAVYRLDKCKLREIKSESEQGDRLHSASANHLPSGLAGLVCGRNIPDINSSKSKEFQEFVPEPDQLDEPKFCIDLNQGGLGDPATFDPLLLFLNQEEYIVQFKQFYDLSFSFVGSTLYGVTEEKEILQYLEMAREIAKRYNKHWAYSRICFLLGRLCAKRLRFSQARVYFEEAMTLVQGTFSDLYLLTALYVNLASVYLKLKMKEKSHNLVEKSATLLLCIPCHMFSSENELEILNIILKKAMIADDYLLEARVCFLMSKLFLEIGKSEEMLPFAEHLQFLSNNFGSKSNIVPVNVHLILSSMYNKKCLPELALAALRLAQPSSSNTLFGSLQKADLVMEIVSKLNHPGYCNCEIPTQAAFYLQKASSLSTGVTNTIIQRDLYFALANLYQQYKSYERAIDFMTKSAEITKCIGDGGAFRISLFLAWLYLLNNQPVVASEILNSLLESSLQTHGPIEQGVVHNMLAISLRKKGMLKEALENCLCAIMAAEETGIKHNQAIAHANFGSLTLCCKHLTLPERYLRNSLNIYLEMPDCSLESDCVQVLLCLGQYYVDRGLREDGRLNYELALLIAMKSNSIYCQVQALEQLCSFYENILHDKQQCRIYYEHWLMLSQKLKDKEQEMKILNILSHLHLSFNTQSSYRLSLDYTKQNLRNFIDLGMHFKEAEAWLLAGKLYYLMEKYELVELYFQAAIQTAQQTENLHFIMKLNEAAGDMFYNGPREREKATSFYRAGAVPLARMTGDTDAELRLFNKLTELNIMLNHLEQALEYAIAAVRLSINTGSQLKEQIAFYRLATVYYLHQQYEMAENYYLKALSLSPYLLQSREEAMYYMKVYLRLGDITLHKLKDAHDAAGYFHLAFAAATEIANKQDLFNICTRLANIYKNYIVNEDLHLQFVQQAKALSTELYKCKHKP